MKILIGIKEFREAFAVVGRFVASKPNNPVYGSVKLSVGDGVAVLSARDTAAGMGVRHEIECLKVQSPGDALLPRSTVEAILKSADDETVTIDLDGLKLLIKGSGSRWSVQTSDPVAFADWDGSIVPSFGLSSDALATLVERTKFATDPASTKYALGGMNIRWTDPNTVGVDGAVTFEATDGRKIAVATCPARVDLVAPLPQLVLPDASAEKLVATFPAGSAVDVGFDHGSLVARCGPTSAFARLLEGRFPDHRAIFDDPFVGKAEDVDAKALRRALDRAAAVMGPSSLAIRFDLTPGLLKLSAVDSESGTSEVEFPIDWDGPEIRTAFQPSFLIPALKAIGDGMVAVELTGNGVMIGLHGPGYDLYAMAHVLPEPQK